MKKTEKIVFSLTRKRMNEPIWNESLFFSFDSDENLSLKPKEHLRASVQEIWSECPPNPPQNAPLILFQKAYENKLTIEQDFCSLYKIYKKTY